MKGQDACRLDMEPWKNLDPSVSTVMEKHSTPTTMHGTMWPMYYSWSRQLEWDSLNWLESFPEYKTRDFFIAGESYVGHYLPQLASLIHLENKKTNQTIINLHGIAVSTFHTWDCTWHNIGLVCAKVEERLPICPCNSTVQTWKKKEEGRSRGSLSSVSSGCIYGGPGSIYFNIDCVKVIY
uniref:Carboxypeptidase n=1 Tax=Lactuca sativa TaxID=4236 RepID=A0A9R1V756_LACSA|nr:hypothetical protein LSAT_V11C600329790 [Lactuca sativa]